MVVFDRRHKREPVGGAALEHDDERALLVAIAG